MAPALLSVFLLVCGDSSTEAESAKVKVIHIAIFERLFLDAGGVVAFPRGELSRAFGDVHTGWNLHFGIGLRRIPIAFGIGGHETSLSSGSYATNVDGIYAINGQIGLGQLYLSQSATVRHFDAFVRLEPDWRRFRPYLELLGGTSQIFAISTLTAAISGVVSSEETSGNLTWEWGYGAGMKVEPLQPWKSPVGSLSLVVSLGVRSVFAGPLRYFQAHNTPVEGRTMAEVGLAESSYRTIEPYLSIGFASRGQNAP